MTTVTSRPLILAKYAATTDTSEYTASNVRTIIDKFTATNTSAGNVTLTVNIVTSGGSAGTNNAIVAARAIAPGETYTCPELVGQVLESGGFISTLAGTASALTIRASGVEIT